MAKFTTMLAGLFGYGGGSAMANRSGAQRTEPSMVLVPESIPVGPDGALQLSTVWSCVDLLSRIVGSLPLFVYDTSKEGQRTLARQSRLFSLLHDSPNSRMTPMEFLVAMVLNLALRGRAYARIERDPRTGEAIALWPMPAEQVQAVILPDGSMVYEYQIGGDVAVFSELNVLHLKGMGNGTEGLSKLEHMRSSVSEAASAQAAATRLFLNGGKPTGILMVDGVLRKDQRQAVAERFSEMQQGGMSRLYVLEASMKFQQLSLSPEDQQLLETRQFSVEEICRWFGVPPVLVHHANVTTWGSGVEQILEGFYKLTVRPLLVSVEQAMRKRVMTPAQRARLSVEFSFDALLRASPKDRMEIYAKAVQNGLKTRNECRQLENDPPIAGGDDLTAQTNLVPLQMLGKVKGGSNADPQAPIAQ